MCYFNRLPYILFRDYPSFGYLTDNRNFGYDTASKSCVKVGERILSKTGSVFYSVLTEKPQSLLELAEKLSAVFTEVSLQEIIADAEEFYLELFKDGFICKCQDRDETVHVLPFSYDNKTPWELVGTEECIGGSGLFNQIWESDYHLSRLHIDVSGLCNERCVHCYFPDTYRINTMPKDLFLEILEQSKACNILNITISGGEPMINPDLKFFIRKCREYNFSINLLSNLTLLTDSLLEELEKTPLLSVQTSLYSMTSEIHDSITNLKGSFIKTKKAIELLHKHNIPMQINCPIIKQNKDTYQDVIDWAASLNIEASSDYMVFGCFDSSKKNLQCRLDIPEVEQIIRKEAFLQNGKRSRSMTDGSEMTSSICPVCTNSLCVSNSGVVYPCEGWQSYALGNVKDTSLSRIWEESPDIQSLRNLTYNDFPKCVLCDDKAFCSICLIRNANEDSDHDFKKVNPYFCAIARMKRRLAEEEVN